MMPESPYEFNLLKYPLGKTVTLPGGAWRRIPSQHASSRAACTVAWWKVARGRVVPGWRAGLLLLRACACRRRDAGCGGECPPEGPAQWRSALRCDQHCGWSVAYRANSKVALGWIS